MRPMLVAGAIVVLDRPYISFAPYRAHQRTLLAVRCGAGLVLGNVEFDHGRRILRPLLLRIPQLLTLGSHQTPADYIVDRVCLVVTKVCAAHALQVRA
jgi:hypothetical protein